MKTYLLPLIFIFLVTSLPAQQDSFVVHEWGTFTQLHMSTGKNLNRLFEDEEPLPSFVKGHRFEHTEKGYIYKEYPCNVQTKMETPVLYFYSNDPVKAEVQVHFKDGSISQWYPERSDGEYQPYIYINSKCTAVHPYLTTGNINFPDHGWIKWNIEVLPGSALPLTEKYRSEYPHYFRARETNSNIIRNEDGTIDKLLFYRGLGDMAAPFKIEFNDVGNLLISNLGDDVIPYVMVYENKKGEVPKVWWTGKIQSNFLKVVVLDNSSEFSIERENFKMALVENGLFEDEAEAMLNTWQESYFESEGIKVFWIYPGSLVEEILPLAIDPTPTKLKRVIVGRNEILTPAMEKEVLELSFDELYEKYRTHHFFHSFLELRENTYDTQLTSLNTDQYIGRSTPKLDLVAYPNPSSGRFFIKSSSDITQVSHLKIYNNVGTLVYTKNIYSKLNDHVEEITLPNIPKGIYLIVFQNGEVSMTKQIVIQ